MDLDEANHKQNLTFSRRYLDPNRVTYEVSLLSPQTFDAVRDRAYPFPSFTPRKAIILSTRRTEKV